MNSPEPTNDPASAGAPPTACVNCGSPEFSARTRIPVCETCRMQLVRHPFPLWVKVGATVVAVLVCGSLALSGGHISRALRLKHVEKMTREERWEEAFQGYQSLVNKETASTETMLIYTEAALNSGHYEEANSMLNALTGRKASQLQVARAQSLDAELGRVARRLQPPPPLTGQLSSQLQLLSPPPQQPLPPQQESFTGSQFLPSVLR